MAMVYDLPTVGPSAAPTGAFDAPQQRNYGADQQQAIGSALTQQGDQLSKMGEDLQNTLDTARTKEADNALADYHRVLLHDPEVGYLNTNQKQAVDAREKVIKDAETKVREIEKTLKTDMQRYLFKQAAAQRTQSVLSQIDGHAASQAKAYDMGETQKRAEGSAKDVVTNWAGWKDPNSEYTTNRHKLDSELRAIARQSGWAEDSAQYKALQQSVYTTLHTQVMGRMVAIGETTEAQDYFRKHEAEIDPAQATQIIEQLKIASVAVKSDKLAGDVFAEFKPKTWNGAIDIYAMGEEIRKRAGDKEDVQESALAKMKQRASEWNASQTEYKAVNKSSVFSMINQGTPMAKIELTPAWMQMDGEQQRSIKDYLTNRALAAESREDAREAREERRLLRKNGDLYLTTNDPTILRAMTRPQVEAMQDKFGLAATLQLTQKWDAIQSPTKYGEAVIDQEDFLMIASALGVDASDKKQKGRASEIRYHVEQALDIAQREKKAPLTRQERQDLYKKEISTKVLIKTPSRIPFRDPSESAVPVIALTKDQISNVVIPPKDLIEITKNMNDLYKKTGLANFAPTRENAVRFYLKKKSPGGGTEFTAPTTEAPNGIRVY